MSRVAVLLRVFTNRKAVYLDLMHEHNDTGIVMSELADILGENQQFVRNNLNTVPELFYSEKHGKSPLKYFVSEFYLDLKDALENMEALYRLHHETKLF